MAYTHSVLLGALLTFLLNTISGVAFAATASSIQDYKYAMELLESDFDSQDNDIRYLLIRSAEADNTDAIQQLALDYSEGLSGDQNDTKALFWLHRYGELVVEDNGYLFAQYIENHGGRLTAQDIAASLYEAASRNSEAAENAYSRILEAEFNSKRSKQISNLKKLEPQTELDPPSPNTSSDDEKSTTMPLWIALLSCFIVLAVVAIWLFIRRFKNKQPSVSDQDEQQIKIMKLAKALSVKNKENQSLRQQLEKLFKELKRRQESDKNHKLQVACAIFGVTPTTIPSEKELKRRYRQLSKLYHPDTLGSDEEMKRLNIAFKVLAHHTT